MRKLLYYGAISSLVMLILPWLAVAFVPADAGMAVCFLLFFILNPVYAAVSGWKAGRELHSLWVAPFLTAALFIAGAWIFFDRGETSFLLYALAYLIMGLAAMGVSTLLRK